jgi:hypothetical protein
MQYEIVGISVYKAMQNPLENPPEPPMNNTSVFV